jgi:hypothetical protein
MDQNKQRRNLSFGGLGYRGFGAVNRIGGFGSASSSFGGGGAQVTPHLHPGFTWGRADQEVEKTQNEIDSQPERDVSLCSLSFGSSVHIWGLRRWGGNLVYLWPKSFLFSLIFLLLTYRLNHVHPRWESECPSLKMTKSCSTRER